VSTLRRRGGLVLEPAAGRLTGSDSGPGRLPEPAELYEVAIRVLARGAGGLRPDMAGRRVVVSAGGTREELDPVRFLGNWSSGRQGYALARTDRRRGAEVTLVAANVDLDDPAGARVVRVTSAGQMREARDVRRTDADAVAMAAAVADFRPEIRRESKIKKSGAAPEPIRLTENPDILRELSRDRKRPGQVIVGFAAETDHVLAAGHAKLAAKGCDPARRQPRSGPARVRHQRQRGGRARRRRGGDRGSAGTQGSSGGHGVGSCHGQALAVSQATSRHDSQRFGPSGSPGPATLRRGFSAAEMGIRWLDISLPLSR